MSEQVEITKRVEAHLRSYEEACVVDRFGASNDVNQLNKSILAKAFRGELVPQDPNDEPASVLLERIRAERAQAAAVDESSRAKPRGRKPAGKRTPG